MDENEDLWIIETDQGDGWTRVRRIKPSTIDPMPEGFVPSSYIETTELFSVPHPVQKKKKKWKRWRAAQSPEQRLVILRKLLQTSTIIFSGPFSSSQLVRPIPSQCHSLTLCREKKPPKIKSLLPPRRAPKNDKEATIIIVISCWFFAPQPPDSI